MLFYKKIKLLCLILAFYTFSTNLLWASYDFNKQLTSTLEKHNLNKNQLTIGIIFNDKIASQKINKIKLKKAIATNLVKNYRLIDPIITHELFKRSKLSFSDLKSSSKVAIFLEKIQANTLLYTELQENRDNIIANHIILSKSGFPITAITQHLSKKSYYKNYNAIKNTPQIIKASNTLNDSIAQENIQDLFQEDFVEPVEELSEDILLQLEKQSFPQYDNSWLVYLPTAYLPLQRNNLEINLGVQNFELARLGGKASVRYSLGFELLELSANLEAYNDKIEQSQARIKLALFPSNNEAIFKMAFGLRGLIYRNPESKALQTEEEILRETQSPFVIFSGFVDTIGAIYNFYLDNYSLGGGGKFFLSDYSNLFIDSRYDYRSLAKEKFISSGFEFYPSDNVGYKIAYKSDQFKNTESNESNEPNQNKVSTSNGVVIGVKVSF